MKKQVLLYTSQIQQQAVDNLNFLVKDIDQISVNIMTDDSIADTLDLGIGLEDYQSIERYSRLQKKLNNYKYSRKYITDIILYKESGYLINTDMTSSPENIVKLDDIKNTIGTNYVTQISLPYNSDHSAYNVDKVITYIRNFNSIRKAGKTYGAIIIELDYKFIEDIFKNIDLGPGSSIYIVDRKGNYIYRSEDKDFQKTINSRDLDRIKSNTAGNIAGVFGGNMVLFSTLEYGGWKCVFNIPRDHILKPVYMMGNITIATGIVCVIISIFISLVVSRHITKPINTLKQSMELVQSGDFNVHMSLHTHDEFELLADGFNNMLEQINLLLKTTISKEKDRRECELATLQAQINPHFLYNTLNTIKIMSFKYNAEDINDLTADFVDLLKTNISNSSEMISVNEEIMCVKRYLRIQYYRYGDILKMIYDIEEGIEECLIPKLVIQPLIENALFHGIEPKGNIGTIRLIARQYGKNIVLSVIDDGIGMKKEIMDGLLSMDGSKDKRFTSIGIYNVNKRIKLYFGDGYGIDIFSIYGAGTTMNLTIPRTNSGNW